ncbi:Ran exchange factor Prp20/Pim1 [Penicillium atrosanguineum]|uniref:Ran exchange factor Prp20/Pim1 n=1 Tax=Penicillium atrosanguineum TaxID=1132637 RepID=UPI00239BFD14|nr:Ran exchange factor Prp20/Pim1 [Penicillium atrosanguineum]KAJ5300585.1 Ran exchange factor Prp20/Pim1 [Penicillium atrosanguineum]
MSSGEVYTAPAGESAGHVPAPVSGLELPSVDQVIQGLPQISTSLPSRDTETIESDEQKKMLLSLKSIIENAEGIAEAGSSFDLKELHASLEQADADARRCKRNLETLQSVHTTIQRLWSCNSGYLAQAAEILANGSRDPSWRTPFGQSGILTFFLEIISSKEEIDPKLLLHSLRLVGNSCADTDENREIVIKDNYTSAIIKHFSNPNLTQVAIPVIYNICMDYEPAHSQMAANKTAYILLKLLKDGAMNENDALLSFSYDLIELASEQAQGVEDSPSGTVLLLTDLAQDEGLSFEFFSPLVSSLSKYLENERFQNACISNTLVENFLAILRRSFSIKIDETSVEETKAILQTRLKINQALAEVSASSLFMEYYPLDSALSKTLKAWVVSDEDQLQICACVMLGNLARSDEVCQVMVRDLKIHEELISVLNSDAHGAVLHSALGFLKNLAIAGDNRVSLAEAGIIPAVSRLWAYDSVPQVQFSAASIARQIIISSVENIARLLAPLSRDPNSPEHGRTYLSLLLSLFEKSDSAPIQTEIGRTIASICRTISPKGREGDEQVVSILGKLYDLHEGVARPLGAMTTQTQWPVVRSEGWFALALMANTKSGCVAVTDCLQKEEVMELLKATLSADPSSKKESEEPNSSQISKDRDNAFVLVQELLKNESGALPEGYRDTMEEMVRDASQRLKIAAQ